VPRAVGRTKRGKELRTMASKVCHFEIPADDVESLQGFYTEMFGWVFRKADTPFEYWMIDTGDPVPEGGMMSRKDPSQGPVNYVMVDSLDTSLKKALGLGAKVIVPKTAVPKFGWFAVLTDPQENAIGLWQDDTNAA